MLQYEFTVELAACLLAVSCMVVSSLLGYFIAVWRQPWMLRALLVVAVYSPLLMIGAAEGFLVFVLQTWLIGRLVGVMRNFGVGSIRVSEKWQANRFSIGTILFLTGVSAGAIVLWQVMPTLNVAAWVSMAVCGSAVISFAVSSWLLMYLAWQWYWRIPLAFAISLVVATLPVCFDWLVLSLFESELYWPPDLTAINIFYTRPNAPALEWYLLSFIVTLYLLFVLLTVKFRKRLGMAGILPAVLVILPMLMPSWTLFKLLTPPEVVSLEATDNAHPAVMDLSGRIGKSQIALQDIRGELDELRELLKRPIAVPLQSMIEDEWMDEATNTRAIARAIGTHGDSQLATGKLDEARDAYLLEIRYGARIRRGGLLLHMVVGVACSAGGIEPLYRCRLGCSAEQSKAIVSELITLTEQLEPDELFVERDRAWSIHQGWHPHLQHLMLEFAGSQLLRTRFAPPVKRELAELRLLATEFAISRYLEGHGAPPKKLEDLIPLYLPKKLDDPFSPDGQAFHYVLKELDFLLYSVGPNGVDDGGIGPVEPSGIFSESCDLSLKHISELFMQSAT